jgi:hypothetical protein
VRPAGDRAPVSFVRCLQDTSGRVLQKHKTSPLPPWQVTGHWVSDSKPRVPTRRDGRAKLARGGSCQCWPRAGGVEDTPNPRASLVSLARRDRSRSTDDNHSCIACTLKLKLLHARPRHGVPFVMRNCGAGRPGGGRWQGAFLSRRRRRTLFALPWFTGS